MASAPEGRASAYSDSFHVTLALMKQTYMDTCACERAGSSWASTSTEYGIGHGPSTPPWLNMTSGTRRPCSPFSATHQGRAGRMPTRIECCCPRRRWRRAGARLRARLRAAFELSGRGCLGDHSLASSYSVAAGCLLWRSRSRGCARSRTTARGAAGRSFKYTRAPHVLIKVFVTAAALEIMIRYCLFLPAGGMGAA